MDGSTLWTFSIVTPLLAGPSVGPDGNIYAADDSRWSQDVIGAFILSPEGQLLWSGGKYYRRGGGWTPQEIKFGGGNAYFWSDHSSTGDPEVLGGLNALHLGGGLFWRVEDGVGILRIQIRTETSFSFVLRTSKCTTRATRRSGQKH